MKNYRKRLIAIWVNSKWEWKWQIKYWYGWRTSSSGVAKTLEQAVGDIP
jgi:hypothetical protein